MKKPTKPRLVRTAPPPPVTAPPVDPTTRVPKPRPALSFAELSTNVQAGDITPWRTRHEFPGADLIAGWKACTNPVELGIVSGKIKRFGGPQLVWTIPLGEHVIAAGKGRGTVRFEELVCDREKVPGPVRYSIAMGEKVTRVTAKEACAHIRKRLACPIPADVEAAAAEYAKHMPKAPIDGRKPLRKTRARRS